jgi:hypothetical protein
MPGHFGEEEVVKGMMAVLGSTDYRVASKILAAEGLEISHETLRRWCQEKRVAQYEELREQWAPKIEAQLANNLLDNARLATATERLAIETTKSNLENGREREPAKVARDISQVKAQAIDKRLALQGRPTQITEKRDVNEIVKALVGMKVVTIDQPQDVPDATSISLRPSAQDQIGDGDPEEAEDRQEDTPGEEEAPVDQRGSTLLTP